MSNLSLKVAMNMCACEVKSLEGLVKAFREILRRGRNIYYAERTRLRVRHYWS